MKNPLNWLKGAALVALTVLCGALAYRVLTAPKLPDLSATVSKLNAEIDEVHRATVEIGLTAMEARKASASENKYLPQWNSEISQTLTDLHETMLATAKMVESIPPFVEQGTSTLKTTQETVKALQAPIGQATATLKAAQDAIEAGKRATETLQTAMVHVDALVTDPAIPATLASVQGTAADVQHVVHKFAFPGIWSKIKGFSLDVAHVFNPL